MTDHKDVTCVDCYVTLNRISATMEMLQKDTLKIVYALIGLIAAQFGLKFLGTPWYLYVTVGVSIVASVFLLLCTSKMWYKIPFVWRILGLSGSFILGFKAICRIYYYRLDQRLPPELGIPVQLVEAFIAFILIVVFWQNGRWNGKERRNNRR